MSAVAASGGPSLALLHDVPRLVREVLVLTRSEVNIVALGVRERADLCRTRRVPSHPHVVHCHARQPLDASLQLVREPTRTGQTAEFALRADRPTPPDWRVLGVTRRRTRPLSLVRAAAPRTVGAPPSRIDMTPA